MQISGTLRHEARECLERAKGLLEKHDSTAARYAALELRLAIEYLAYQQFEAYLAEVPDDAMRKWTPREVIAQMLEVDPYADKSATIAFGVEEVPGETAKEMKLLGEDRRFTLKWANRAHNALGNFLHAPTLHQIETGSVPTQQKIREKAEEVFHVIEHTLATPIFNVNLGNFYEIACVCGRQIKRREGSFTADEGIVCPNVECRAVWDVVSEQGLEIKVSQRRYDYVCSACGKTHPIASQRIKPGLVVRCECGQAAEVDLAFFALEKAAK